MRWIVIGVLVLWLSSCASKPIPLSYNCPRIMLPPDPILPTRKLTTKSRPDQVAKAYRATVSALRGWNSIVRKQVQDS